MAISWPSDGNYMATNNHGLNLKLIAINDDLLRKNNYQWKLMTIFLVHGSGLACLQAAVATAMFHPTPPGLLRECHVVAAMGRQNIKWQ